MTDIRNSGTIEGGRGHGLTARKGEHTQGRHFSFNSSCFHSYQLDLAGVLIYIFNYVAAFLLYYIYLDCIGFNKEQL